MTNRCRTWVCATVLLCVVNWISMFFANEHDVAIFRMRVVRRNIFRYQIMRTFLWPQNGNDFRVSNYMQINGRQSEMCASALFTDVYSSIHIDIPIWMPMSHEMANWYQFIISVIRQSRRHPGQAEGSIQRRRCRASAQVSIGISSVCVCVSFSITHVARFPIAEVIATTWRTFYHSWPSVCSTCWQTQLSHWQHCCSKWLPLLVFCTPSFTPWLSSLNRPALWLGSCHTLLPRTWPSWPSCTFCNSPFAFAKCQRIVAANKCQIYFFVKSKHILYE